MCARETPGRAPPGTKCEVRPAIARQDDREPRHCAQWKVYGWFTEGFDTRDLKEAKVLLEELAA